MNVSLGKVRAFVVARNQNCFTNRENFDIVGKTHHDNPRLKCYVASGPDGKAIGKKATKPNDDFNQD